MNMHKLNKFAYLSEFLNEGANVCRNLIDTILCCKFVFVKKYFGKKKMDF